MSVALILAAAIAGPTATGVHADEQPAYSEMLATRAREADAFFSGKPCASATVDHLVTEPWKIVAQPDLPVWREHVKVAGCGRTTIENINVARMGGLPPWKMFYGLPGRSAVMDVRLQQSTYQSAVGQVHASLPADCQSQELTDIYLAAKPGDVDWHDAGSTPGPAQAGHFGIATPQQVKALPGQLDLAHAWVEVWPFTACGRDRTLGVVFVPPKDASQGVTLFLPIWQQIEAHGPNAKPKAVTPQ